MNREHTSTLKGIPPNAVTQPVFYGWYVVAIAFDGNFLSLGTGFYVINTLMEPLCERHG